MSIKRLQYHSIKKRITAFEEKLKETEEDTIKIHYGTILKTIELMKDNIEEHAARRVDLFFYLLVSVYGKKVVVSKDDTTKEHGKGSKLNGTHACHSSLFPSIKMESPERKLRDAKDSSPSLSGTFFEESLNATVELPEAVNGFDGHIEGRKKPSVVVQECEKILNSVSKAKIDPKQGMDCFFKTMNNFFTKPHKNYFNKSGKNTPAEAKIKVAEYTKTGTFFAAKADYTVREKYIHLMLRLNPDEIKEVKETPDLLKEKYYPRIQNEIYATKVKRGK